MKFAETEVRRVLNGATWDYENLKVILDNSDDKIPDGIELENNTKEELIISLELIAERKAPDTEIFHSIIPDKETYSTGIVEKVLEEFNEELQKLKEDAIRRFRGG